MLLLLWAHFPLASVAQTFPVAPQVERAASLPERDVRQLLERAEEQDRYLQEQQIRKKEAEQSRRELENVSAQVFPDGIKFFLKSVKTTQSSVLTEEEIQKAVAPFLNKEITGKGLTALLESINHLYRLKGYVVCQAVLTPQRISKGQLTITLVEGKTGQITVKNVEADQPIKTRESYIRRAFEFEDGKVANYRDMLDDLIRFNMTNDVQLAIDLHAGKNEGTTDYDIFVQEPDERIFNLFADSSGAKSSGRYRIGIGYNERNLLGYRDRFQFFTLASRGAKSLLGSYSLPLNSYGTRLSASISYGHVKVVDGPSEELDIKGDSLYYSLRLEHPFYVTSSNKLTGFIEASRQKSTSDMLGVLRINDSSIKYVTGGLEDIWVSQNKTFYGSVQFIQSWAKEYAFDIASSYRRLTGTLNWDHKLDANWGYSAAMSFQKKLAGGELSSTDYFYLGTNGGVRGYEVDVISAYNGLWINLEGRRSFFNNSANVFAFFDYGRISGPSSYTTKEIYSTGFGARWQVFNWLSAQATLAFPLKKSVTDFSVTSTRFDFTINMLW